VPNTDAQTATDGRVNRYNGLTGVFLDVVIPSLGIDVINGLIVGPDGNLYVSAFDTTQNINGRILRFDGVSGAFIDVFVQPGSGGLVSPFELTFGPRLCTALPWTDRGLY
jgi:hypothetical protein